MSKRSEPDSLESEAAEGEEEGAPGRAVRTTQSTRHSHRIAEAERSTERPSSGGNHPPGTPKSSGLNSHIRGDCFRKRQSSDRTPQIRRRPHRQRFDPHHPPDHRIHRIHDPSGGDTDHDSTHQRFHIHGIHKRSQKCVTFSPFPFFYPAVRVKTDSRVTTISKRSIDCKAETYRAVVLDGICSSIDSMSDNMRRSMSASSRWIFFSHSCNSWAMLSAARTASL